MIHNKNDLHGSEFLDPSVFKPDPVVLTEASLWIGEGDIIEKISPVAERILCGNDEGELVGRSLVDVVPSLNPALLERSEEIREDKVRIDRKDGTWTTVRIISRPLADFHDGLRLYILLDVADEPVIENHSMKSESFYSFLFREHALPMLLVDPRTSAILEVNTATSRYYGYTREDLLKKRLGDFLSLPDRENTTCRILFYQEKEFVRERHRLYNGTERDVELRGVPVLLGTQSCLLLTVLDVTDWLASGRKLQNAWTKAETVGKARSDFIAHVAHELRTPASGVLGLCSLLEDTELSKDQSHLLSLLFSAAKDLFRLLEDMSDFSRIDAGKIEIKPSIFAVLSFSERVAVPFRRDAEKKGLEFVLEITGDEFFIGDETRIAQILSNLMSNAIKYTDSGKVVTKVHAGELLSLIVEDTGFSIPPEGRTEIFEPFKRLREGLKADGSGLGIGLSLVRKLTELMGGEVSMEESDLGGSRFIVIIPRGNEP